MKATKRLLAAAVACVAVMTFSYAEGVSPAPTFRGDVYMSPEAEVTALPDPGDGPTAIPEPSGDPEPTAPETDEPDDPTQSPEPTASPSPDPTPSPEPTQSPDPTASPSPDPTLSPEPTQPEPTQSADPTAAPSPDPTPAPDPTRPIPTPGPISEHGPVIMADGNVQMIDQTAVIFCGAQDNITFRWTFPEGSERFYLYVEDDPEETRFLGEAKEPQWMINAADYLNGTWTLYVGAVRSDDNVAWGKLDFRLHISAGPEKPSPGDGDMPPDKGRLPGGGRPGTLPGGGSGGGEPDQGFRVTPGKALTDAHVSGTKDMRLYGSVALETDDEPMAQLSLGGELLPVSRTDGGLFKAEVSGETLILTAETADGWQVGGSALKTLRKSGILLIRFTDGASALELSTDIRLSGPIYGELCRQGVVSKDQMYIIEGGALSVRVQGDIYTVNEKGELEYPGV